MAAPLNSQWQLCWRQYVPLVMDRIAAVHSEAEV